MRNTTFLRGWLGAVFIAVAALAPGATGATARRRPRPPLISLLADPCSEVCSVNLCVVQGAIQRCPEMCPGDLHLDLPAEREVTLRLPFAGPEEVGCRALGRERGRHHVCA